MSHRENSSNKFVLSKMHSLDDIPTIVKNAANIFSVYSTGEVRVAVVFSLSRFGRNSNELIANEELGLCELGTFVGRTFSHVAIVHREFGEIFLKFENHFSGFNKILSFWV